MDILSAVKRVYVCGGMHPPFNSK